MKLESAGCSRPRQQKPAHLLRLRMCASHWFSAQVREDYTLARLAWWRRVMKAAPQMQLLFFGEGDYTRCRSCARATVGAMACFSQQLCRW